MKLLVTGAAGFIGSHVCKHLCNVGMKLWVWIISIRIMILI